MTTFFPNEGNGPASDAPRYTLFPLPADAERAAWAREHAQSVARWTPDELRAEASEIVRELAKNARTPSERARVAELLIQLATSKAISENGGRF